MKDSSIFKSPTVIAVGICTVLSAVSLGVSGYTLSKLDNIDTAVSEQKEVTTIGDAVVKELPTLTETTPNAPKGGTATITTEQGQAFEYTIPSDHYNITSNYLSTVATVYGVDSITAPNIVITGDGESVTDSQCSINASTFSNTRSIYEQIFDKEMLNDPESSVYSPAYGYILNGEAPDGTDESYVFKRLDDIVKDGVTYKVVTVDYDTDYTVYVDEEGNTIENPEKNIVHSHNTSAYSDTEDVIEIIAYTANDDVDKEYDLIKSFIGVE